MSTIYEIPLTAAPQKFPISLAGVSYNLRLIYNETAPGGGPDSGWILDINDSNGNPIVTSIPLVTGANLLEQYPDAGIGGELWVQTDVDAAAVPTFANLGSTSHLYFVVP